MRTTSIELSGPFSLEEVAMMGFGHRDESRFDGVMRLAFCLDHDLESPVGVEVRQDGGRLDLRVHGEGDLATVVAQVARIVSADHDGAAFDRVCAADRVLATVHAVAPGFGPALFHSAYDACVWSVLSARRQRRQAIALRQRLSVEHGRGFELAGQRLHALPTPATMAALAGVPGLPDAAVPRLVAIAKAATAGCLDVDRLAAMPPEVAMTDLQRLPGIGPFYSALVVIRSLGLADVLSTREDHSRAAIRDLHDLDHDPDDAEVAAIAEAWRPFRTWAAVMLRALTPRLGPAAARGLDGVGA